MLAAAMPMKSIEGSKSSRLHTEQPGIEFANSLSLGAGAKRGTPQKHNHRTQ